VPTSSAVVQLARYAARPTRPRTATTAPITLDDHQHSRWIAPIRPSALFACCRSPTAGRRSRDPRLDRAASTQTPVYKSPPRARGGDFVEEGRQQPLPSRADPYGRDVTLARAALSTSTGITRYDIDVALIYARFTHADSVHVRSRRSDSASAGEQRIVADGALRPPHGGSLRATRTWWADRRGLHSNGIQSTA